MSVMRPSGYLDGGNYVATADVRTHKTNIQASGNHVAAAKCLSCARVDILMAGTMWRLRTSGRIKRTLKLVGTHSHGQPFAPESKNGYDGDHDDLPMLNDALNHLYFIGILIFAGLQWRGNIVHFLLSWTS